MLDVNQLMLLGSDGLFIVIMRGFLRILLLAVLKLLLVFEALELTCVEHANVGHRQHGTLSCFHHSLALPLRCVCLVCANQYAKKDSEGFQPPTFEGYQSLAVVKTVGPQGPMAFPTANLCQLVAP